MHGSPSQSCEMAFNCFSSFTSAHLLSASLIPQGALQTNTQNREKLVNRPLQASEWGKKSNLCKYQQPLRLKSQEGKLDALNIHQPV